MTLYQTNLFFEPSPKAGRLFRPLLPQGACPAKAPWPPRNRSPAWPHANFHRSRLIATREPLASIRCRRAPGGGLFKCRNRYENRIWIIPVFQDQAFRGRGVFRGACHRAGRRPGPSARHGARRDDFRTVRPRVQTQSNRSREKTSTRPCQICAIGARSTLRPPMMRIRARATPPWETTTLGRSCSASQGASRSASCA